MKTGYDLDNQGSILTNDRDFSLRHHIQIGYGAHPASYSMGTWVIFFGGKECGVRSWTLTSTSAKVKNEYSYISTSISIRGAMLN